MGEQVSLFDLTTDKKERRKITPEVWTCTETCANFTNIRKDGTADYFPERGGKRCVTPFEQGDKDYWDTKLINNVWHTWCKYYKPK